MLVRFDKERSVLRVLLLSIAVLLAVALGEVSSSAQSASITGRVSFHQEGFSMDVPVKAVVKVTYDTDLSRIVRTNDDGSFKIDALVAGTVRMVITPASTSLKLKPFDESFTLQNGENVVIVTLEHEGSQDDAIEGGELQSAIVSGKVPSITVKGDTLVYHTAGVSDKLQEGDYAIEALKNMPGVRVENGTLKVFGESVVRTYVNGALIFGLSPLKPFENIKADEMISFDVYDEDGAMKVANMTTKNMIFSVADIQTSLAYGRDEMRNSRDELPQRYRAAFNGDFYSEMLALGVGVKGANLGQEPNGDSNSPSYRAVTIDREDLQVGVVFEKYWKHRILGNALQVQYDYEGVKSFDDKRSETEWFALNTAPARFVTDTSKSHARSGLHSFKSSLVLQNGIESSFAWRNRVEFADNSNNQSSFSSTSIPGMSILRSEETSTRALRDFKVEESVTYRKRQIEFSVDAGLSRSSGLDSFVDTLGHSFKSRFIEKSSAGEDKHVGFTSYYSFQSPFQSWLLLRPKNMLSYRELRDNQSAVRFPGLAQQLIDDAQTYDYTTRIWSDELSVINVIAFRDRQIYFDPNFAVKVDRMTLEDLYMPSSRNDRLFVSFAPDIRLNIRNKFHVSYKGNPTLPSSVQLRPRINDSNPLLIMVGNPDLVQSYTHSFNMSYVSRPVISTRADADHAIGVSLSADFSVETNPMIMRSELLRSDKYLEAYSYLVPTGAMLQTYVNAPSSLRARVNSKLSFDFENLPSLDIAPSLSYSRQTRFYGGIEDRLREISPSVMYNTRYSVGSKVRFSSEGTISYVRSYTESGSFSRNLIRGSVRSEIKTVPVKRTYADLYYNWTPLREFSGKWNKNDFHELNVNVGMSLMKQALRIGFAGLNLLNSSQVYSSITTPDNLTNSWKPSFGRTFLITLSYRFNTINPGNYSSAGSTMIF